MIGTLPASNLAIMLPVPLGQPGVASSNNIVTFQGSNLLTATSIGSTTFASATQPIGGARNLRYEINISGDATGMVSAGTLSVAGSDIQGNAITETMALTDICSVGSASFKEGSKCFMSLAAAAFTVSGYLLHTGSSTRSLSISVYVGHGNVVGMPNSVQSSNAIKYAQLYNSNRTDVTAVTGNIPNAGVSITGLNLTNPLIVYQFMSR
jgi:hypothetical protein